MFDVTWVIDGNEFIERYDEEIWAKNRYNELINSKTCQWVQIVQLISNWSEED